MTSQNPSRQVDVCRDGSKQGCVFPAHGSIPARSRTQQV